MNVTIEGATDLARRFGVSLKPAFGAIAQAVGELVRNEIAVYPGPVHHPIIWASLKQKRWWFAHRREKGLPFEYTRQSDPESQRLGPSWTVRRTETGAVVGTRVTYAPWVQKWDSQSAQHKATGWVTDREAISRVSNDDVRRIAVDAVIGAIRRGM